MKLWRMVTAVDRYLGVVFLLSLIFLVLLDTLLRAIHLAPFVGTIELVRCFLICSVFITLRYVASEDGHIRMDEVMSYFPSSVQTVVKVVWHLAAVAAFGLITASAISSTIHNARDTTPTLEIPFILFFLPTTIGFFLATIQYAVTLAGFIRQRKIGFSGGSRIARPAHGKEAG